MSRTIRLLSDWGLYPFYVDRGDGRFALTEPPDFQEEFGVPDDVMSALLDWDRMYQDVLDWDDPGGSDWPSPADQERYVARGREVALLLRRHLPADVGLLYHAAGDTAEKC